MKKCDFEKGLKQFRKLIKENNYKLRFCSEEFLCVTQGAGGGYCSPVTREIGIQKGYSYEKTLYALAHEVGHMLDINNLCENSFVQVIKRTTDLNQYIHDGVPVPKSLQIFCIRNELSAWEIGLELLTQFGIPFSVKTYKLQQVKSVCDYVHYMAGIDK